MVYNKIKTEILFIIFFFSFLFISTAELDFTAARGMGALNKELASKFVPFFLLKASKEICIILKESTNCDFSTIETTDDLEYILENSK